MPEEIGRQDTSFTIREQKTEQDMEHFVAMDFESLEEYRLIDPEKPKEESFRRHKEELLGFIGDKPQTGIFIGESDQGELAGFIWVSVGEVSELWDFKDRPAWIYNVWVLPEFRRGGLGKRLLREAERWAQKQGLTNMGLHVFGSNQVALSLYRSAGYSVRNCYFQKHITPETIVAAPPSTTFRVRERETARDQEHICTLGYEGFRALARAEGKAPEEEMRAKYDEFMSSINFDEPKHCVYVAEDEDGIFAGFVWLYVSQGDLGSKKYTWMQNLQVVLAQRGKGLGKQLLGRAEGWTMEQGLDTMRTGVHAHSKTALYLFRSTGYKETNFFLQKRVSKR